MMISPPVYLWAANVLFVAIGAYEAGAVGPAVQPKA
jgi:hypothetical protein